MGRKQSLVFAALRISVVLGILAFVGVFSVLAKPASADSPAFVRIIHASPGIGTAVVFLDGTTLLNNFQFGTVTGYATIPPGPHRVQIALIGKGPDASVITQTLSVNPGGVYTVAALGTQATGFSLQVFIDNNLLATGMAKLRVYHLSPGIGSANVSTAGNMIITGLPYPQASNYVTLPAGSYTFILSSPQANATLPISMALKANTVTSLFAVGMFNGNPKMQFVTAQVAGLPAVPLTGSDPNPAAASGVGNSQPLIPWLFGVLVLLVISASITTRRLVRARVPDQSL